MMLTQGGIASQKAPTLVIAFNSSWCSSGTEGSVTDTHVHYFLFDLILDEPEVGYDFNKKQCQRGEEGVVEESVDLGYKHFKMKVGGNLEEDKRRLRITREAIGYDKGNVLMVDANQVHHPLSFSLLFSLVLMLTNTRSGPSLKQ